MSDIINIQKSDEKFMQLALVEAKKAFDADEVPVGAVVVLNGKVIARAHNLSERLNDVTAHAEMQVITMASTTIGGKYLNECTLYVTLEPCTMCAGACYWAQLGRVVFGASDSKKGYHLHKTPIFHPKTQITSGILAHESEALLKSYFQKKRT